MAFLHSCLLHGHPFVYERDSYVLEGARLGALKVLDISFICQTLWYLCLSTETPPGGLQESLCGFEKPHWTALTPLDFVLRTVGL